MHAPLGERTGHRTWQARSGPARQRAQTSSPATLSLSAAAIFKGNQFH